MAASEVGASWFETREGALLTMRDYTTGMPVFRTGSISSGLGPERRLCMWTMKAMPNSGVARLTTGIDTKAAMNRPAVNTVAALSLRIALASAGERNRIAASSKYSRPSSQAVAMTPRMMVKARSGTARQIM